MPRQDYRFPFRIDAASRQGQKSNYAAHVQEMIRQVLLTAPGERVNLPEFGCGIRQLVFAPMNEGLDASLKITVLQALGRWLADHIDVKEVKVLAESDLGTLHVDIEYVLRETQTRQQIELKVT